MVDGEGTGFEGLGKAGAAKERILLAAEKLLEAKGYHATGMAEMVEASGAPKGSVYYHFPGGKEEIASEAVLRAGRKLAARISGELAGSGDPALSVPAFIRELSRRVEDSGYSAGGPLTIVAAETATSNERVGEACREAFGLISAAFASALAGAGYGAEAAESLATAITASIEGALLMSRTMRSGEALRTVASSLASLLELSRP
jgi:TetR/AcrR family transcriptional repressor of lmrAB and yxaGH operons